MTSFDLHLKIVRYFFLFFFFVASLQRQKAERPRQGVQGRKPLHSWEGDQGDSRSKISVSDM